MTNTLQPLLSKDKKNPYLSIYKSTESPETLEVYFELALLEKIDNGLDSYHGKHLLGRLYNSNFKRKDLVATFGYPVSTLQRWGEALLTGDAVIIHQAFSGQGAVAKITPDIKRFVISKFNEIYPANSYDYSKKILKGIKDIFNETLTSEAIRPIIKNEKEKKLSAQKKIVSVVPMIPAGDSVQKKDASDTPIADMQNIVITGKYSVNELDKNSVKRANGCESKPQLSSNPPNNRKHSLSNKQSSELRVHHLGIILALYFINTLNLDEPIVYQWLASILAGSVNIEQMSALDFESLDYLLEQKCITSKRQQHTILTKIADEHNANSIFKQNARILKLSGCRYFYFDPHSISYEGMLPILKGWCGSAGKICKVYYQDFFHDDKGNPVYFKIYDNYFDMRERFKDSLIDDFKEVILQDKNARPTFIIDRGIYGQEKMEAIHDKKVGLVTWEKGYLKDAWSEDAEKIELIIQRTKNSSKKFKTWEIIFIKDETWDKINGFYRLIVRIKPPKKNGKEQKEYEVSILTNGYISDLNAVKAMLSRWVQENDFKYMIAHFGLNEITSYKFDNYSEIQKILAEKEFSEELQKILIEKSLHSDEYKQHSKMLTKLNSQAKTLLLKKEKADGNQKKFKAADETELQRLLIEIKQIEKVRTNSSEKISKLALLIKKDFKILNSEKKRYMDAIKILARNIFYELIHIFRPIYDNFREDHKIVRELTQASGIVKIENDTIFCNIDTPRNYTKKQKKSIDIFLNKLTKYLSVTNKKLNGKNIKIQIIQ